MNPNHPFMRGIMNFDDYNYKQYNSFVLVEEPKTDQPGQSNNLNMKGVSNKLLKQAGGS